MAADGLAESLIARLREHRLTLAVAESCTGGLIGARLTGVAGASDVFVGGVISYANAVKSGLLGVPADLLDREGAVSAEVVRAMAEGVIGLVGSSCSVAATGIAGPGGATPGKPVGLVYLAAAMPPRCLVRELRLSGDRREIRRQTVDQALRLLSELIG